MADKAIQSFARSLNLMNTKGDLYMGANHLPLDKQGSLRLFQKYVEPEDVLAALLRMQYAESGKWKDHLEDEEIYRLFQYIEPWFILLDIEITAEEVIEQRN